MHHHNHATGESNSTLKTTFLIGIILNSLFVVTEFILGFVYHSMGLLADAGHNLGDIGGLLISLAAFQLASKRRTRNFTYGFRKATVMASLINAVVLFIVVGAIVVECVPKFFHPVDVGGWPIIWAAGTGIFVNGFTALLLRHNKEKDLNVKGAYLHMFGDTLVSVGVVLSGILLLTTGWTFWDPLVGLVVAFVILLSGWDLLRESVRLSLDGVPSGIDVDQIRHAISDTPNVTAVHHLHIWPISTTENALTSHVALEDLTKMEETKKSIREKLHELGVTHSTLEFESAQVNCSDSHIV
ncbi:MAG: cation diffusion facilitator family transporter [Planctomycetia bacterium]|nr:cation diffusion facilitator family transporter [Planctomycetia bacterium]